MKRKYLIFVKSYDENNGGSIVLHKLCSTLNELGHESYLLPIYNGYYELMKNNSKLTLKGTLGFIRRVYTGLYKDYKREKEYKTNPLFNTPILKNYDIVFDDEWVVIYPEVVFGNPLKAKNVVRWLLHQPGFHSGNIFYNQGDVLVKFNSAISDFNFTGISTLKDELKVIHYPLEYYNLNDTSKVREGTAYCLRKGRNKKIQHDLTNSILIDGKSHAEIAAIFKQVKTFISYDTLTAYSLFAVLCGCDSVVIPDEGVTQEEWYPNPQDRYGIAYGFSDLEHAHKTAHLVKNVVLEEEEKSVRNVKKFVVGASSFFG